MHDDSLQVSFGFVEPKHTIGLMYGCLQYWYWSQPFFHIYQWW